MEASKANKEQVRFRMSDDDLAPIRKVCEAGDLNLSVVIRETLVRHGLNVAIELVHNPDFQATTAYAVSGRRLKRRSAPTQVTLAGLVQFKFDVDPEVAAKWVALGRIDFKGELVTDPALVVDASEAEFVTKHAAG